ncbi:MAG: hypothetical protein EAX95_14340 [Candidatus Thorarchaeota archaeon]|nr:hypothetical protein [Candidatus Thorarchaeota archaeon]
MGFDILKLVDFRNCRKIIEPICTSANRGEEAVNGLISRREAATLLILSFLITTVGIAPVAFLAHASNNDGSSIVEAESSDRTHDFEPTAAEPGDKPKDTWGYPSESGGWVDFRDLLAPYKNFATEVKVRETQFYEDIGSGFSIDYKIQGNRLRILITIGSYSLVSYTFEEGKYQAIAIPEMQINNQYGEPALPYRSIFFSIPDGIGLSGLSASSNEVVTLRGLNVIPGPRPLAVAEQPLGYEEVYASPLSYAANHFSPIDQVPYQIANYGKEQVLLLRVYPLQYNPLDRQGRLTTQMEIEIDFSGPITSDLFVENPDAPSPTPSAGEDYVIIADASFSDSLQHFIDWKTSLGFNVSLMTVQNILSGYSGRDDPEKVRNFIKDAYLTNESVYFFLVGDGDVVPVREVEDPYNAGQGLDNGTEPTDFYYECLDGDWDQDADNVFGEYEDDVDLFPEVMVGRIPVQTPAESREVCASLIRLESDPVPGEWMDNFILLANDCFGIPGDGPSMVEGYLNQQFLYNSFFDVTRLISTDGSLSSTAVVDAINNGAMIVDFFDHGAYNVWSGALSTTDASNLQNGNMSLFAFAMACETAAFDYEAGEPTIAEAFFRNSDGGASIYIGATRIAWAGYHCFDGFHHRFWHNFLPDAISEKIASPKAAFHAALYEMATVFDTSVYSTLETIYQAIYFGDPAMNLYWKHDVSVEASVAEPGDTIQVNGTCSRLVSLSAIVDSVDVTIRDPFGGVVYGGTVVTNSEGMYSVTFPSTSIPGIYTVETTISSPFESTEINTFNVGSVDVNVQLDSDPVYHTLLSFSGTASLDGTGNVSLLDAEGSILGAKTFTVTGGTYSDSLNVTAFGPLRLVIQVDGTTAKGGSYIDFKVSRGDILVINYASGGYGPSYPGGWADSNEGDSSNAGDYYRALSTEYNVTLFFTIYEYTPSLEYLQAFDVVVVSTGDNYGVPLMSSECYMLDILQEYHDSGGEVLYEGGAFLAAIDDAIPDVTSNLMHVDYSSSYSNQGGAYFMPTGHPVTSGLPASIQLTGTLGSPLIDSFTATNGSTQVSEYSGTASGAAIAALSPSETLGGVVVFGFSIDGIADIDHRSRLITNAIKFLIYPTLIVEVSDDAMRSGTSEIVNVLVKDAATGTPVEDASVVFSGCGVSETNTSKVDGTCSVLCEPINPGFIDIGVSKKGFINYTSQIIVYELPSIAISTNPDYLVRDVAQDLLITATDFYEHDPIEGVLIEIAGEGISDSGLTNSSGDVEFVVTPTTPGMIQIFANLSGYVNTTDFIGVLLIVLVLPGLGTEYSEMCSWDYLMLNWDSFGTTPLLIDYTSMTMPFDLNDINAISPDVLIWDYQFEEYTALQLDAIKTYTQLGHGLLVCGGTLSYNIAEMADFLGISDSISMTSSFETGYGVAELTAVDTGHPLMTNLPETFATYFGASFWPVGTEWDSSVLAGATYIALDASEFDRGAVLTYRGMVYCSLLPEYESNGNDMQLVYNSLTWSKYEIPDHDLGVTLQAPDHLNPEESTTLNATVYNLGLNIEANVNLTLYIDGVEVDSLHIASFENGTSQTLSYIWSSSVEAIYNVTASITQVPLEETYLNNIATKWVNVKVLHDYIMLEGGMVWYDAVANGVNLGVSGDDVYTTVVLPFVFSFYDSTFDRVYVSSNGWFSFTKSDPWQYWPEPFPSDNPDFTYAFALFMADLRAESNIYAWTTSERAVIQYNNYRYLSGNTVGTFQVALFLDGHIEFNYLDINTGSGYTVGLNYGDGVLYNSFDSIYLADGDALKFYYTQPEHEVGVALAIPSTSPPGVELSIDAVVMNYGTSDETDIDVEIYIGGTVVASAEIGLLTSSDAYVLSYDWTPPAIGIYNITARISTVAGDSILENNIATVMLQVQDWLQILTPSNGATVIGGSVYVTFDANNPYEIEYLVVYVNEVYIYDTWFSGEQSLIVPVFQNGTNYILIGVYWGTGQYYEAGVTINSASVKPLISPEPGDYFNWMYRYWDVYEYYNFTFNDWTSEYVVSVRLDWTYEDMIGYASYYEFDLYVNVLNGYITQGSEFMAGMHLFWLTDLAEPHGEIGSTAPYIGWNELLTVEDSGTWNGYAVWEMIDIYGYSDYYALRANGLLIGWDESVEYWGRMTGTSFNIAADNTAPEWVSVVSELQFEYGEAIDYTFQATDESGIGSWSLSLNIFFDIDDDGTLGSTSLVPVGDYPLTVYVEDIYGNENSMSFTAMIRDTTGPSWTGTPTNQQILLGDDFEYVLGAWDLSGVHHWTVNDTVHFAVNSTGGVRNIVSLSAGVYALNVTVFDIYGNINSAIFTLTVEGATTTEIPFMYMVIGSMAIGVVAAIVVLLVIRRRMR